MRLRSVSNIAAVVLAVAWLAACANPAGTSTMESADGLSYASYEATEEGVGDAAILKGTVQDHEGCLTVQEAETQTEYVPVFPNAATIATSLRAGDDVELGGGAQDGIPEEVNVPEECSTSGPYWIVVE